MKCPMSDADVWVVDRSASGVMFESTNAGFELDTTGADDPSHTRLSTTLPINGSESAVAVAGTWRVDDPGTRGAGYMRYTIQPVDKDGTALGDEQTGRLPARSAGFEIRLKSEPREGVARLRLTLLLNRVFKLRASLQDIRLEAIPGDSPRHNSYRTGFVWPGTTSMSWLDGKSMYVCAGCEPSYVKSFSSRLGCRYTTRSFIRRPWIRYSSQPTLTWRSGGSEPDFMVLSTVQNFRALLSSYEQRWAACHDWSSTSDWTATSASPSASDSHRRTLRPPRAAPRPGS